MVVFTCGHCGEAIQKPKVEKHYLTKCRNLKPNLSCMDCFKDFLGQDYTSHIKCVTEEERYGGKNFVPKEKKGEQKQNAWVEMIKTVLDEQKDLSRNILNIIQTICQHTNTPRKKPKFVNFVKNVCGHKTNPKDIECAWELIAAKLPTLSQNQNKNLNDSKLNDSINNSVSDSVNNLHIEDSSAVTKIENNELNGVSEGKNEIKAKTKRQLKEEKKQKKYETDLRKAAQPVDEIENVTKNNSASDSVNDSHIEDSSAVKKTENNEQNSVSEDKNEVKGKTKKQLKEEKKQKKYETELRKAAQPVDETENVTTKKEKKKKNKSESSANRNDEESENQEETKNKKRKRIDTVNSVQDVVETELTSEKFADNVEPNHEVINGVVPIQKIKKKKLKMGKNESEESVCLHDQNVINAEQLEDKGNKFNWHEVIISVLEKKGDEIPFKRLQKKVLGEYSEMTGLVVDDRIADKFIKKLKSAPNVLVDKNRVVLLR